ncbi:MAG: MFS transporter, partial [Thermoplasmata archaeon]
EIIGAAFLAYIAAFSLAQPVTGKLSDKIGRKRPIVIGLLLTSVTMYAMGIVATLLLFVLILIVSAVADALITPSTTALVSELSMKNARGQAMGLLGLASDGGLIIGPIIGGLAWDFLGQLMPFVLCAIVVGLMGIFAIFLLDEK